MAEKINYPFVAVPLTLLQDENISPTDFRILCNLLSRKDSTNICRASYKTIAEDTGINRRTIINSIANLCQKKYLSKKERNNFKHNSSISNEIRINFLGVDGVFIDVRGSDLNSPSKNKSPLGGGDLNSLGGGDLNSLGGGDLNSLGGDLNSPNQDLNDQDLNNIFKKNKQKNQLGGDLNSLPKAEFLDDAKNRSMPDGGQAAKSSAGNEEVSAGAAKTKNQILIEDIRAEFTDIFADLSLSMAGNTYILRKKGKYALIEDVRLREVLYWMMRRGLDARILDPNTRVLGETLLEEVA